MRKLAHVERILSLTPIPGADLIEAAKVQGWTIVVKKGLHKVDDLIALFEIDSLIPIQPWSSFLFKDKRDLYRLRTVRLKGTLSQGLVVGLYDIPELFGRVWIESDDLTEVLSIRKWEPVLPANLAGQVKGNFPAFLRKTDECRVQSAPSVLDEIKDLPIYAAIKCDGCSATYYKNENIFGACSRNLDLREEGGDDYWALAKALDLPAKLPDGFAIQAEMCGPGIQGNKMGLTERQLFVFNVFSIASQTYLDYDIMVGFVEELGLQPVPLAALWSGNLFTFPRPETVDEWLAFADTIKYPNGAQAEGIVVRTMDERYSPALDGRLSFKVISNAFLLKTGE